MYNLSEEILLKNIMLIIYNVLKKKLKIKDLLLKNGVKIKESLKLIRDKLKFILSVQEEDVLSITVKDINVSFMVIVKVSVELIIKLLSE